MIINRKQSSPVSLAVMNHRTCQEIAQRLWGGWPHCGKFAQCLRCITLSTYCKWSHFSANLQKCLLSMIISKAISSRKLPPYSTLKGTGFPCHRLVLSSIFRSLRPRRCLNSFETISLLKRYRSVNLASKEEPSYSAAIAALQIFTRKITHKRVPAAATIKMTALGAHV